MNNMPLSTSINKKPLVSIIIRTKNEEKWITSCLRSVYAQAYDNLEVVLVDNCSTDQTIAKASLFPVKIVSIEKFIPGKAINDGIKASQGEVIVCLSGHCIPTNNHWLENLVEDLISSNVAGVYGRQEPLSFSSDLDKRDLLMVFGLDKKVQKKDSFFHNANSAFTRSIWDKYPFDEQATNIEDRLWGDAIIKAGYEIIYRPDASVYHWHGIHHGLNPERARNIVRILENIDSFKPRFPAVDYQDANILAIVPVKGSSLAINNHCLLQKTIQQAVSSSYISNILVSTDCSETAELAVSFGAQAPFLRPASLSEDYIDILEILKFTLEMYEQNNPIPDFVFLLEETYPFRPEGLLDKMVERAVREGLDCLIAAKSEERGIWLESEDKLSIFSDGFMPRTLKQSRALVGLVGLGLLTRPMAIRSGNINSGNVGLYEVDNPFAAIQVRDSLTGKFAAQYLDNPSDLH